MGKFSDEAEKAVENLDSDLQKLKDDFDDLVTSFGENSAKVDFDLFFEPLAAFLVFFSNAVKTIEKRGGMQAA